MNISATRPSLNSSDAYLDWDYQLVSSIVFVPLTFIGISGNLMVILVVMTVRGMKTPTNLYLTSLASADCLFFVSTFPSELSSIHLPDNVFLFGRVGCSLLRFLPYLSINASSLSIIAFTIERYIGICHPMKARYICTVKRAQYIIVTIWTFSILYNSTWLFLTDLKALNYADWPDAYQCTFSLSRESYKAIFLIDIFLFYWIPLLVYLILYGIMARTLIKAGVFDLQPTYSAKRHPQSSNAAAARGGASSSATIIVGGSNDHPHHHRQPSGVVGRLVKSRKIKSSLDTNSGIGHRLQRNSTSAGVGAGGAGSDASAAPLSPSSPATTNGCLRSSASLNENIYLTPPYDTPLTSSIMLRTESNNSDTLKIHAAAAHRRRESTMSNLSDRSVSFDHNSLSVRRNTADDANSISSQHQQRPSGQSRTSAASSRVTSKAYYGDSLNRSRAQVVKMLIVIVVTFALFCLPYRGLVVYNSFTRRPWMDQWYILFAKTMVMVNCAINPILYNVMSGKFRNAFILMFKRCFRIRRGPKNFHLRHQDPRLAIPRSSISVAVRQQQARYAAINRASSESRYSFSRSSNIIGTTPDRPDKTLLGGSSSFGGADKRGERNNATHSATLLIPIIALTPDSNVETEKIMDESRTELVN